jgi:lipoprotein-anchoring transpeptidase ErfK/SrfK
VLACSLLVTVATAVAGVALAVPREPAAVAAGADDVAGPATLLPQLGRRVGERLLMAGGGGAASGDASAAERPSPPSHSGQGRRVVFDMSAQRVWLVRDDGKTAATYLVSGSIYDNLSPGRYEVFSRSRRATSFDYASTMEYMVRFTYGNQAAIGFHDIPVDAQGRPLQPVSELGTPTSHGCIRQREVDARRMWRFAPVGTPVVVTA